MLEHGEKVVAAVPFRDVVLVFGDRGTVLQLSLGAFSEEYELRGVMSLRREPRR